MDIEVRDSALTSPEQIAARIASPGFGSLFTDRMLVGRWQADHGWHDFEVVPYGPLSFDPAANILHYAQQVFEGLKAHRQPSGDVALFRPVAHAARFERSAQRLCIPPMGSAELMAAVETLVGLEAAWVPARGQGSLYLRPTLIATEAALGVKVSSEYLFSLVASPVGQYFRSGRAAVRIWVEPELSRAAPGGVGDAKTAGSYASGLLAMRHAKANDCDQVLFLDASEHRKVEELGGMNVFAVIDDVLVTPALTGTILPGVTRASLLELAGDLGIATQERTLSIDEVVSRAADGGLTEMMATGTAAVVASIGELVWHGETVVIGGGAPGQCARQLGEALIAVQTGAGPDPRGWRHPVLVSSSQAGR